MASFSQVKNGYRAQVYVQGVRDSQTFRTKREAVAWAKVREDELRAAPAPAQRITLQSVCERYAAEVSPSKRGERWERIRLEALVRDPALRAGEPVGNITPEMLGAWRDARMREVERGTVLREMTLLSAVFETARREWRLIPSNPMRDVRRVRAPDHRTVTITRAQIKAMLRALGYKRRGKVRSVSQAVAVAFLLALRTGMRAGEICGLTWDRVGPDYCRLPVTKTKPRDVPLEPKARALIERMRGWDERQVFGLKTQSLDTLFRKARKAAGLEGFTFHDARHTAATWLALRLDVLDLCRMFGWAETRQALTYYNPTASQIAGRLSGKRGG